MTIDLGVREHEQLEHPLSVLELVKHAELDLRCSKSGGSVIASSHGQSGCFEESARFHPLLLSYSGARVRAPF